MLLLLEAQEGNWDDVDLMIRAFQGATMGLRNADVRSSLLQPASRSAAAARSFLHADRVQAAAESYIGLVEVGVGLIPAGGGTKEMLGARRWRRCRQASTRCRSCSACSRRLALARVSHERARMPGGSAIFATRTASR